MRFERLSAKPLADLPAARILAIVLPRDQELFAAFRDSVTTHFRPIAAQFGLGAAAERLLYPDVTIEFPGELRKLAVSYEVDAGSPWVSLGVRTAAGHLRSFGLHTLVEHRRENVDVFAVIADENSVAVQVRALAVVTLEHATDLFAGRIVNVRGLYLRQRRRLQQRTEQDGYFPPERRPMLHELFAACTAEQRAVCAYHAVVDYEYGVAEVAAFLSLRSVDVEQMIELHDTIRFDDDEVRRSDTSVVS